MTLVVTEDTDIDEFELSMEVQRLGMTLYISYAYFNIMTNKVTFSLPKQVNNNPNGYRIMPFPYREVEVDWNSADRTWRYSNEVDEMGN